MSGMAVRFHGEVTRDVAIFVNRALVSSPVWCRVDCTPLSDGVGKVEELLRKVERELIRAVWFTPSGEIKAQLEALQKAGYAVVATPGGSAVEQAEHFAKGVFRELEKLTEPNTEIEVQFKIPHHPHIGVVRRAASR